MLLPPSDFGFSSDDDLRLFAEVLRRVDYTQAGALRAVGLTNVAQLGPLGADQIAARLGASTPLDTLLRLFWLNRPVDAGALRTAVAPLDVGAMVRAGLVRLEGGVAHSCIAIAVYEDLVFAHDSTDACDRPDYVMGMGVTSLVLDRNAVRTNVARTLDLGCGSGFSTLRAARHSGHVVGLDINPRAVRVARFNAGLNAARGEAARRCEFREGSWFEPVRGETFDLIHANLPFVITDGGGHAYFSANMRGDELTHFIIRQVPQYLAEGGFACLVCNWAHVRGEDTLSRLRGWVDDSGCDAMFLARETVPAYDYAVAWAGESVTAGPEQKWETCQRWFAAYQALGIEAITYGIVTLRKATGRGHWFGADDIPAQVASSASEQIVDIFAGRTYSIGTDDASLMAARLSPSAKLRAIQSYRPATGAWKLDRTEFACQGPYPFARAFDQKQAEFVLSLDGTRTIGEAIEHAAARARLAPGVLAPVCVRIARQLLERGMVLPSPGPQ